jgi:hypothetical protein
MFAPGLSADGASGRIPLMSAVRHQNRVLLLWQGREATRLAA